MKQLTVVITIFLVVGIVAGAAKAPTKDAEKTLEKTSEKVYPKKVTSLKKRPTKTPNTKSAVESFKDLPADDLEFIKELDKQFKLHGDKIKIKVERDNSTLKNSKRTVEGDLGYGYYNGEHANGYNYPKPKFEFYPYSQQDIPPSAPGYHIKDDEEQSTVSIIPSYSYEIKQTPSGGYEMKSPFVPSQPLDSVDSYQPQQAVEQGYQGYQQQHNEPVIVLRIPGPTKYASHLQALLQQYLEVRASQYLRILEEAELQKQQQQQQQHQQVEQLQYENAPEQEKPVEIQYQQPEQQSYGYPEQEQEPNYPGIADVYQSYKGRHQESTPIEEPQYEEPVEYSQQPASQDEQQQPYYYMQVEQEQPMQGYQPIYYVAMPQSDYGYPDSYGSPVPQGYVDDTQLPIAENNPRNTHTKVLFTEGNNKDYSTQYPLPSIKPFERHAPTPTPSSYQQYQNDGPSSDYQQQEQYQSQPVVAITQRPYNYHAHSLHGKNTKRMASPAAAADAASVARSENLKKLHAMVNRLRTSQPHSSSRTKKEAV